MSVMILAVVPRSHKRSNAAIGATNRVATSQSFRVDGSGSTISLMTMHSMTTRVMRQMSRTLRVSLRGAATWPSFLVGWCRC